MRVDYFFFEAFFEAFFLLAFFFVAFFFAAAIANLHRRWLGVKTSLAVTEIVSTILTHSV